MAKFSDDIIRTTETLPGTTGGVRARLDVDTGAGLAAGAVAELGKALFDIGQLKLAQDKRLVEKRREMTDTRSMITADSLVNEAEQESLIFRETNPDTSTWEPDLVARLKEAEAQIVKLDMSGEARDFYSVKLRALAADLLNKNELAAARREKTDTKAAVTNGLIEAVASGDQSKVKEATKLFQRTMKGLVDFAEVKEEFRIAAEVGLRKFNEKSKKFMMNQAAADPVGVIRNLEAEKELRRAGQGAIKKVALSDSDIEALLVYASGVRNRKLAQQKVLLDEQINAEQGRLMRLARTNRLTDEIIQASKLSEFGVGSKDTFYKMIDAQAKAVLEEKKTPYTESDPVVEARILDRIRDPDFKIDPKDISSLVGKGLSIDDASRMIGMLDIFKDPWFKRIDMYLKSQLGWDGAYEKFAHPQGGIAYKLASDKLFEAIETEKLRGENIYKRGSEIAIPFIADYWENVLMLDKEKREAMTAMLRGEPAPKVEKPKEVKPKTKKKKSWYDPLGIFD